MAGKPTASANATHLRPQRCGFIVPERGQRLRRGSGVLLLDAQTFKVRNQCSPNPLIPTLHVCSFDFQSPRIKHEKTHETSIVILLFQCLAAQPIVFKIQSWTCCGHVSQLLNLTRTAQEIPTASVHSKQLSSCKSWLVAAPRIDAHLVNISERLTFSS